MPPSRNSGPQSEPFSIRWLPIANMDTSSADLMSSPDPLNDSGPDVMVPSSMARRVTRSQRSNRFVSLASSPRKQTFELEVGNNKAPQKLLVTVETEDALQNVRSGGARRKLFQSSSPAPSIRRRERATTTIVPLKETIEEEAQTPRRRGRPRKSNGTPLPGAGAKRRAGTPIKRTPRKARTTKNTDTEDELQTPQIKPTPRSGRRGRPPKNRVNEPSSELGVEPTKGVASTTRGKRKRQAMVSEEVIQMADQAAETSIIQEEEGEAAEEIHNVITARRSPDVSAADAPVDNARQSESDAESDIWMATLDDEPTPRVATWSTRPPRDPTPQEQPRHSPEPEPEPEPEHEVEASEGDAYGYFPPARSDVSSVDEPTAAAGPSNNDTIAQGEDFSMIFMDSLPSLQATLRNSLHEARHTDFGEETSLIINNTLESLRQSFPRPSEVAADTEPEADAETAEPVEASVPDLPPPGPAEPQPSATRPPVNFSPSWGRFRNLSPRWTQSPRRTSFSPLRRQVLKFQARQTEDDPTQTSLGGQLSPGSQRKTGSAAGDDQEVSHMYEDSFSEIPQGVLDAATPGRALVNPSNEDHQGEEETADEREDEYRDEEMEEHDAALTASNASAVSRSDAGRLPTPDDTPPQPEAVAEDLNQGKSTVASQSSPLASSPSTRQVQTIPPAVEETVREEREEHVEDILPEFPVPRPSRTSTLQQEARLPQVEVTPVNQMTSPAREPQSLLPEIVLDKAARPALSPIVRAGRALQSVTSDPPSPEPREKQLRSPFRSSASKDSGNIGRGISMSPRRPLAFPEVTQIPPINQVYEDPFGSDTRHTGQASFMQALGRSSVSAAQKTFASSRESTADSMRITPPSDDEMSWVANEGPISPSLRGDVSLRSLSQQARPRGRDEGALPEAQLDSVADDYDEEQELQDADDETDLWEFEAKRSAPRTMRQQPFGTKIAAPAYRRGTIPSPWVRQSAQAEANLHDEPERDEEAEEEEEEEEEEFVDEDMTEEAIPEVSQAEEYSLLARREKAQQQAAVGSANKASRFDLSSFFSSPATIPGKIAGLLPGRMSVFRARAEEAEQAQETITVPTTSMFPQVPQKEFQPMANPRMSLFSSTRTSERQATPQEHDVTPDTPEKLEMPSIPQKRNFTPRPRQPSQSFFQRSGAPTPPRMQLSHADIERWQQETSNASESPEFYRALLRPLPPRDASPTKSSLRSPLKPHTPGRVVEFTSSVLSPVEQAKARMQRRLSNSSAASQRPNSAPQAPPPQVKGKENHTASDASTPDTASPAKQPEPLSRTVWTRQHWLLLDDLLQMRRQAPFDIVYQRRADRYLGKTVKSQGEAMRLERWHLDCVDAFKAEVGGWDEGALVKRLFALILGEERRRRGVVGRSPRVMFH